MSDTHKKTGSDLFIVDNSDQDWKVLRYLHDWCQLSKSIDIATGYFEIGSLLALDGEWQKVDQIRILLGDEVSHRTKKAFVQGLEKINSKLDSSLEGEKEKNDFLTGVPAIVDALRSGKIQCRVYKKDKFHAKAYITHARLEVVGSSCLVGSSNFTFPGLSENIELNIQITGHQVNTLQDWYEKHWNNAEDVTPEILRTVERHTQEYHPFEVYAKSLKEFFRGHEMTATEWELNESRMYKVLAKYQQDGYQGLLKRAAKYNGAFLCDGVGLGKTFVGLMLIERLVMHDNKRVALFVPKAAREDVWETTLKRYIPDIFEGFYGFKIFNHTDLLSVSLKDKLEQVHNQADVIIIDEAHHFRNTGTKGEDEGERRSRYWQMHDLAEGKQLYLLTATPVNNKLTDYQHMIELFSRNKSDYFKEAPLGIHSLPGHIRKMDKALENVAQKRHKGDDTTDLNLIDAEDVLAQDDLFNALVVQRSRSYVKKSVEAEDGAEVVFPEPREPKIAEYSVKQTYGKLLAMVEQAFSKEQPLFALSVYFPYAYYIGDDENIDPLTEGRQKQVVSLIRIGFLKRFESSAYAFEMSCRTLMLKLLAWIEVHSKTDRENARLEKWKIRHADLINYVHQHQKDLFEDPEELEDKEDVIPIEFLEIAAEKELDREEFDVEEILADTYGDLDQLVEFLNELTKFQPKQDKKLTALIKLLKNDPVLKEHKVLIFSEYMTTTRYLKDQLIEAGIEGVAGIDSQTNAKGRSTIIKRFAPYYNGSSSAELVEKGLDEIRVLVSTDVLSEGLNLQDATRLINYDLHWNPVRLMQRIGRVDRRMNSEVEAKILADHPDQKKLRGTVGYWNFLPPGELDELLKLYSKVSHKTLRISKTFGIEGRKLLKPDDDYEDLKNFHESYEGTLSPVEDMHLELQQLFKDHPDLSERLDNMPLKIFSGKSHPKPDTTAIFFCYARPAKAGLGEEGEERWSIEAGDVQWYLYDIATEKISNDVIEIIKLIRSTPETPRECSIKKETLSAIREKLEKHIKNTYLKKVQAPIGIKAVLKAWMELN